MLMNNDHVNIGLFMKVAECVKYGHSNTAVTAMNKASNRAMSVSLFINFHKLQCPVNNNNHNSILVFVKWVNCIGKRKHVHDVKCDTKCQIITNTVKTVISGQSKKKTKIGFQDRLSLNAGQKYCRMLQGEHSAILSTFIKLPFVFKIFVL